MFSCFVCSFVVCVFQVYWCRYVLFSLSYFFFVIICIFSIDLIFSLIIVLSCCIRFSNRLFAFLILFFLWLILIYLSQFLLFISGFRYRDPSVIWALGSCLRFLLITSNYYSLSLYEMFTSVPLWFDPQMLCERLE